MYNVSGVSGMDAISEEETRMGHGDSPPVCSQLSVAVRDTPHTPHSYYGYTDIGHLGLLGSWLDGEGRTSMQYGLWRH